MAQKAVGIDLSVRVEGRVKFSAVRKKAMEELINGELDARDLTRNTTKPGEKGQAGIYEKVGRLQEYEAKQTGRAPKRH